MAGLIHINSISAITPDNLWHNFVYLEDYLRVISTDTELAQSIALDTDFQQAIADILSVDLNNFISNLADSIYNKDGFLERIVEEDTSIGGDFDGLAVNLTFLQNLVEALSDSDTFIVAFVDYLKNNAPEFFESLEGDVFKAYFGPDISLLTFATIAQEIGVVGVYKLWDTGEPEVIGNDSRKYVGVIFGLEDDFQSDFNLFVSRDSSFANTAVLPEDIGDYPLEDPDTAVLRFTHDGNDYSGGAVTGLIAGPFFDSIKGLLLLDISKLEWDGQSKIYIKLMGTKSNLTYIRVGFDYVTHSSQVTEEGGEEKDISFATVIVNTQDEWEKIAGGPTGAPAGEGPEKAVGYWNGSKIIWPANMRVILGTVDISDYGAKDNDVFDGGYAYKMYHSIYFEGDNPQIEGIGKVTIVKGNKNAIFRSILTEKASTSHTGNEISTVSAGDFSVGDLIHYAKDDQYYYVLTVDAPGNKIQVDRKIVVSSGVSTITRLIKNIQMWGFTYDGRGGILYEHEDPALITGDGTGDNNMGGGFAYFQGVGNSKIDVRVVNSKAKNGGAMYLDRCYNVEVPNIQYCEAVQLSGNGGKGGGIYGGYLLKSIIKMCKAYQGGGFSENKKSELYAIECSANIADTDSFDNCQEPLLIKDFVNVNHKVDNLESIKAKADMKLDGNLEITKRLSIENETQIVFGFPLTLREKLLFRDASFLIQADGASTDIALSGGEINTVTHKKNSDVVALREYSYNGNNNIEHIDLTLYGDKSVRGKEVAYSAITDNNLDIPDNTYDTISQIVPCKPADNCNLDVHNLRWTADVTDTDKWEGNGAGGSAGIRFKVAVGFWSSFTDVDPGLKIFYLPKSANEDILGGYFEFYYYREVWSIVFNGISNDIVIATDGSVYVGSISTANLVINRFGQLGTAGKVKFRKVYSYTSGDLSNVSIDKRLT